MQESRSPVVGSFASKFQDNNENDRVIVQSMVRFVRSGLCSLWCGMAAPRWKEAGGLLRLAGLKTRSLLIVALLDSIT
jgi:hypothetical protein